MSRVLFALVQGFVVAVSKGDRRDLVDADLLGVKRSKNCIEDLTSGSEEDLSDSDYDDEDDDSYVPIGGSCGSATTDSLTTSGGSASCTLGESDLIDAAASSSTPASHPQFPSAVSPPSPSTN